MPWQLTRPMSPLSSSPSMAGGTGLIFLSCCSAFESATLLLLAASQGELEVEKREG